MAEFVNTRQSPGLNRPFNNFAPDPIILNRAPTANDRADLGTMWIQSVDTTGTAVNALWVLTNPTVWTPIEASGQAGNFTSLTVTPGPIALTGTTTINTAGAANTSIGTGSNTGTITIGNNATSGVDIFGATFINSSINQNTAINTGTSTGSVVIGNSLATAVSIVGPTSINTSGSLTTSIGVGGTGSVLIGNATGNTTISAGNLTVTAGNIVATNGNLTLSTLGNKLNITTAANGTNASVGTTAAMAAGTIVVANTAVTANSKILVSHATAAGTLGQLSIGTITPGVNFAILTDNVLDVSTVNFLIIN